MPIRVHFVAAVGRVSEGDLAARPQIESVCARNGGRIVGGMGDSTNPIVGEFNERAGACAAAQEAFYLDSVEFAKVIGDNDPGEITNRIGESVTSGSEAVDAVAAGMSVKDVVESLIKSCSENLMGSNPTPEDVAAYKAGYADGAAKQPAQPTADKAYVYGYEHGFKLKVPLYEGAAGGFNRRRFDAFHAVAADYGTTVAAGVDVLKGEGASFHVSDGDLTTALSAHGITGVHSGDYAAFRSTAKKQHDTVVMGHISNARAALRRHAPDDDHHDRAAWEKSMDALTAHPVAAADAERRKATSGDSYMRTMESVEPLDEAKNRWGHTLKKGMKVKVAQARGEAVDDEIADFPKADDYSRAYGRQVTLKSGRSAGVNDCLPT